MVEQLLIVPEAQKHNDLRHYFARYQDDQIRLGGQRINMDAYRRAPREKIAEPFWKSGWTRAVPGCTKLALIIRHKVSNAEVSHRVQHMRETGMSRATGSRTDAEEMSQSRATECQALSKR